MEYRWRGLAVVTAALIGSGGLVPLAAHADGGGAVTDLYVSRAVTCSDSGPGTQTVPYCSMQEAADVVQPGQTVHIGHGYYGSVIITRSGTPDAPISFVGEPGTTGAKTLTTILQPPSTTAGVIVSGAHDVRISDLMIETDQGDGIDVSGSSDITLEENQVSQPYATSDTTAAVKVDGASSDVSITRNYTHSISTYSLLVSSGAQRITVAANVLENGQTGEIHATGVLGLVMTGNTFVGDRCAPAVTIDGSTTGGSLENNVLWPSQASTTAPCAATALVSVAADAVDGVRTAYNALSAAAPHFDYDWAGTAYQTAADLTAAVPGEGQHDLDVTLPSAGTPAEGSPLIDSADAQAPGATAVDFYGKPRSVDDPNTINSGTGAGTMDRGAFERQSTLTLTPTYSPDAGVGPAPYEFAVSPQATDSWGETLDTTVDFGDGDGPQSVSGGTASHTYTTPGAYTVTTTTTNADGQTQSSTKKVTVGTVDPPQVTLTARPLPAEGTPPGLTPDYAQFTISAGADTWEITRAVLSGGDGRAVQPEVGTPVSYWYQYPGTYTAMVTTTDVLGRTQTATATITVGKEILPVTPSRVYDSRSGGGKDTIPAHGTVKLSLPQLTGLYGGASGVVMTATVTNAKAGGHLTAYPDGTTRPNVSQLNFPAGKTVANLLTAEVGSDLEIAFYNGSDGPIDLILDTVGVEDGSVADTYSPVGPVRVLDTRNGTGAVKAPVAKNGTVTLALAGQNGVPSDAQAVLLNVTTTDTQAGGHVTVYGHGMPDPGTSNSNWAAGQTVANLALVKLTDGKVVLHNASAGTVAFVADLVGYYHNRGTASVVVPTPETRVLDTRNGTGTAGKVAKIGPKQHVKLRIAGLDGVPSTGASAAELNLTAVSPTANGYLTLYPDGMALPTASSLNYRTGHTVANASVTPIGPDGAIDVYNGGSSPVDVVIDQSGYYYAYAE